MHRPVLIFTQPQRLAQANGRRIARRDGQRQQKRHQQRPIEDAYLLPVDPQHIRWHAHRGRINGGITERQEGPGGLVRISPSIVPPISPNR